MLAALWQELRKANPEIFGKDANSQLYDFGVHVATVAPLNLTGEGMTRCSLDVVSVD